MSLRTTYTGAHDTKLAEARAAGVTAVSVTNLTALTTAITNAANKGQRSFTYNFTVSYQPADLRLLGPLWDSFKTGILQALAAEDIMNGEVAVSLNTSDQLSTSVDIKFSF
jgi:hypothetical protein